MAILGKLAKVAYKMSPKRKAALAKAVKASAQKRALKGGAKAVTKTAKRAVGKKVGTKVGKKVGTKVSKKALPKVSKNVTKRTAKTSVARKKLTERKAKLKAFSEKYSAKADRTERNLHGSLLKSRGKINIARKIKLGHFARKSRRLGNQSKRIGKRLQRRGL